MTRKQRKDKNLGENQRMKTLKTKIGQRNSKKPGSPKQQKKKSFCLLVKTNNKNFI